MDDHDFHDLTLFITNDGKELVTDSRAVAIAFKKKHLHVIRDIRNMLNSARPEIAEHARSNFGSGSYPDAQGQMRPMFSMTRKGFAELAMSYTGEESRVIRIRFLNAFELVSDRLAMAERSLVEKLHDHDKRSAVSMARARLGSRLMNDRRKEKPELDDEEQRLKEIAQPKLFVLQDGGSTKH